MEALKECFSNHESLIAEAAFRIHKISINILTSGLEHDILQWQNELEKLPKPIQDQLLSSVEDMFCPLFLTHLRWSQPNDWKLKYFTLLFHRALNFEEDLANDIVDKIPNYLKTEVFDSVLQFFLEPDNIPNDPNYPASWGERYGYMLGHMTSIIDCPRNCLLFNKHD